VGARRSRGRVDLEPIHALMVARKSYPGSATVRSPSIPASGVTRIAPSPVA
jgi:hypothetical protein